MVEMPLVMECNMPHNLLLITFTCLSYHYSSAGVDYNLLVSTITIQANDLETCSPSVQIVDDDQHETTKNFYVTLAHPGADVSVVPPSSMEFLIFGLCYECNKVMHTLQCLHLKHNSIDNNLDNSQP